RVPARHVFVVVEADAALRVAPYHRWRRDLDRGALGELRARDDEEPRRLEAVLSAESGGLGGAPHDALLRCLGHPLRGRADDEDDEAVEEHEERDLEDQERFVGLERDDRDRVHDGSERPNTISVEPIVMRSPSRTFARSVRLPLTSTPFVEPRSTIR